MHKLLPALMYREDCYDHGSMTVGMVAANLVLVICCAYFYAKRMHAVYTEYRYFTFPQSYGFCAHIKCIWNSIKLSSSPAAHIVHTQTHARTRRTPLHMMMCEHDLHVERQSLYPKIGWLRSSNASPHSIPNSLTCADLHICVWIDCTTWLQSERTASHRSVYDLSGFHWAHTSLRQPNKTHHNIK